ncbi:ribonuclease H-like domain-containing protein [Tanacetum coccineum]
MWLFHHKYLADGTLSCYKARLVVNASTQLEGVDVDETFNSVVKPGTIRTVHSLAAFRHWPIHQLDIRNAFLHGDLSMLYASSSKFFSVSHVYSSGYFLCSTADLVAYSYADCDGCPTTRRLTSGYCEFFGNNLLSWSSKRQPTLSRSSAEAEYRGVANAVAETCWLRNLLRELHTPLDLVTVGQVRVLHVPSRYQYADIFTKCLPSALFEDFHTSLSVRCPLAPTAGEC